MLRVLEKYFVHFVVIASCLFLTLSFLNYFFNQVFDFWPIYLVAFLSLFTYRVLSSESYEVG